MAHAVDIGYGRIPTKKTASTQKPSTGPTNPAAPWMRALLDSQRYVDQVYGGLVSTRPEVQQAVEAQYDYNKKRVQAGKEPLAIADVAWNPQAYDDDTNEALALWYRDKGSMPDPYRQSEFDYMRQEYSRQKAPKERQAGQPEKTAPQPVESASPTAKSRPVLDFQPVLYDLADRLAYTKNVYGGDASTYWRNRDVIDAQFDYNNHPSTAARGVAPIADLSWNPNDHDDDTNEALGYWYRDNGTLPGVDHRTEFDYMRQEYSRQKAAGERMANGAIMPAEPETDKSDGAPSDDLLLSVMKPEQLSELNDQVLGTLDDRQRQQIASGEANLGSIFDQLSFEQQEKINQLSQSIMSALSPEQKTDLLFLSSGMLSGIDLQKRKAILQHLKENDGAINYDDLVRIGVFRPEELAEGGIERWLQNMDIGGPAHLHELLEKEYRLNNLDTSFAKLDQEDRQRRIAQQTMLVAMAAAPAIDRMINGPGSVAFGDNVYDNIERYGTQGNFKGSDYSWKPPTDTRKRGDFQQVADLNDFKARIPSNAQELPWKNIEGGSTDGIRYRWTDAKGNVWNVRAHNIDPNAPPSSNASKGWVYRVEVRWGGFGKKYYMDSSGNFHPENVLNPNSPMYNEAIANDTHIILGNK